MKIKRVKQIIQILTVILVLDGLYLFYKYYEYGGQTVSHNSLKWQLQNIRSAAILDKYIKNDFILSERQAQTILNPEQLTDAQLSTSTVDNATNTVVFLKTHKTGSSTVQNILLRYFILHNLTIALPAYRASFFWPNRFSSYRFVKTQKGISQYHAFLHHTVYNKPEILKVMQPNPSFITILREPISLFRSAYKYYNMQRYCFNTTVEEIKSSVNYEKFRRGICPATQTPVRNLQAFDLGLALGDMEDERIVRALIEEIDKSMTVVLITERFDESLLLLRKKFNWNMEDMVYFKQNAQIPREHDLEPTKVSTAGNVDILQFNYADHLIYTHFNERLDRELKEHFTKEQLQQDLDKFNYLQAQNQERCIQQLASANSTFFLSRSSRYAMFRPYGYHTLGYVLKAKALHDITCRLMAMPELTLTHYLKAVAPKT